MVNHVVKESLQFLSFSLRCASVQPGIILWLTWFISCFSSSYASIHKFPRKGMRQRPAVFFFLVSWVIKVTSWNIDNCDTKKKLREDYEKTGCPTYLHGREMRQVLDSVSYQVGVRLEDFPRTKQLFTRQNIYQHLHHSLWPAQLSTFSLISVRCKSAKEIQKKKIIRLAVKAGL